MFLLHWSMSSWSFDPLAGLTAYTYIHYAVYPLYLCKLAHWLVVKAPLMVGPTWMRVRLTLGSDCLPALSQGTASLLPHVSWTAYCSHVHDSMIQMIQGCISMPHYLWAPGGCFLLPTLSTCMVPCIPWWTIMFMIEGECWGLLMLMLCRLPYNSITDSHCTWIAVF